MSKIIILYNILNLIGIYIVDITSEIDTLRKIIGSYQKSILVNLCCIEQISDPCAEVGQVIVTLKVADGKRLKTLLTTYLKFFFNHIVLGSHKKFRFNHIFNGAPNKNKIECMIPMLNSYLSGENACVIAHGQTGI